ncbi:MAG: hypothetical protein HC859_16450 [Bacteroidia bacterium]|nr:hypothetical protein [Bacteroidia bacterium]
MKHTLTFAVILVGAISHHATAQSAGGLQNNMQLQRTVERLAGGLSPGEIDYGIPLPPGRTLGDTYLGKGWRKGSITLLDGDKLIEGYFVRYNIELNEFEIRTPSKVRALDGKKVKNFIWLDSVSQAPSYFVAARDYKDVEGGVFDGFLEVISDGPLPLLVKHEVFLRKSDYNVALQVGTRDAIVEKRATIFYAVDGVLYEVPRSKKKMIQLMAAHEEAIAKFIKINQVDFGDEDHLAALFDHYNKLSSKL